MRYKIVKINDDGTKEWYVESLTALGQWDKDFYFGTLFTDLNDCAQSLLRIRGKFPKRISIYIHVIDWR